MLCSNKLGINITTVNISIYIFFYINVSLITIGMSCFIYNCLIIIMVQYLNNIVKYLIVVQ